MKVVGLFYQIIPPLKPPCSLGLGFLRASHFRLFSRTFRGRNSQLYALIPILPLAEPGSNPTSYASTFLDPPDAGYSSTIVRGGNGLRIPGTLLQSTFLDLISSPYSRAALLLRGYKNNILLLKQSANHRYSHHEQYTTALALSNQFIQNG